MGEQIHVDFPFPESEQAGITEKEELVQKIINYITKTPYNTNVNILRQMLIELCEKSGVK